MSKVIVPNLKFDPNEFELEGEIVDNVKQKCLDGSIFEYYLVKTKYGINKYIKEEVKPIHQGRIRINQTHMSKEKELTQGERYVIAQTMDDFENTWNDHQEFDDMDVPRLRSELTKEQLELLNH